MTTKNRTTITKPQTTTDQIRGFFKNDFQVSFNGSCGDQYLLTIEYTPLKLEKQCILPVELVEDYDYDPEEIASLIIDGFIDELEHTTTVLVEYGYSLQVH